MRGDLLTVVGRLSVVVFGFLGLVGSASAAELLEGRVFRVADGVTLTVFTKNQTQVKVRLAGIYAPERGQPLPHHHRWDTEEGRCASPHPR